MSKLTTLIGFLRYLIWQFLGPSMCAVILATVLFPAVLMNKISEMQYISIMLAYLFTWLIISFYLSLKGE